MEYEYPKYMKFNKKESKAIEKGTKKINKYLQYFIKGMIIGFLLIIIYEGVKYVF